MGHLLLIQVRLFLLKKINRLEKRQRIMQEHARLSTNM